MNPSWCCGRFAYGWLGQAFLISDIKVEVHVREYGIRERIAVRDMRSSIMIAALPAFFVVLDLVSVLRPASAS
jgi:hypothetical protein